MFEKILIANRGEIALRIHRTCREMGISTVAVHSTADENAMHVRLADESVCIGPPPPGESYLNMPNIVSAAMITGAEAIHPGYGFLAENADFAEIVEAHGIAFIGPTPNHIRTMGDKVAAKRAMTGVGISVVPGTEGAIGSTQEARKIAGQIGYPVLIKAASGGGGKGMRVAESPDDLDEQISMARREARSNFGDDQIYLEKYLANPRHIELQIIADEQGHVVHIGERDCSLQRKHQKVLEEAPSPGLNAQERERLGDIGCNAVRKLGYRNAGTLEFLYENGEFYFIEMNTRLQVEHPVSEAISGIDIVREQIRIAAGAPLFFQQKDIDFQGHAIECRVNAEDPVTLVPWPGRVSDYHPPGGLGIRVDSGIYAGYSVPPHYDSMIAKLIVHGATRNECLMRLRRALEEFVITGVRTTVPLHQKLIGETDFINGRYDIRWLESYIAAQSENL